MKHQHNRKTTKNEPRGPRKAVDPTKMPKNDLGCTESVCCLFTASTTWALKAATTNWKTWAKGKWTPLQRCENGIKKSGPIQKHRQKQQKHQTNRYREDRGSKKCERRLHVHLGWCGSQKGCKKWAWLKTIQNISESSKIIEIYVRTWTCDWNEFPSHV